MKEHYSSTLLPQMQIYCYQPHRFHSLDESIKAGGRIAALAVLFEVCARARAPCCVIRECNVMPGVDEWESYQTQMKECTSAGPGSARCFSELQFGLQLLAPSDSEQTESSEVKL